ncbi:TlpA family protein disulfide reductase [Pedobacter gandavensis]|uniref:Redoxin family protein n=1 Tax=Pedobacter gandavensis TaxID=2679963 RepID=A0ABR6ESE2_9SPHI|nr:TlpA disulfide reductase family protein [Pedobacter gandavensis]MBB2147972.1 redoxin family protein [Pedobacter gandavensis]
MFKKLIFTLLTLCLIGVAKAQIQKGNLISILNPTKKQIHFEFFNEFNDMMSLSIHPGKTGIITSELPIVVYNGSIFNKKLFLLYPDDSLKVSEINEGVLNLVSPLKRRNQELLLLNASNHDLNNNALLKLPSSFTNLKSRDSLLYKRYIASVSFLDDFVSKHPILPLTEKYIRSFNRYDYLKSRVEGLNSKAFYSKSTSATQIDSLVNLKRYLNCDDCLNLYSYRQFALAYLYYLERSAGDEKIFTEFRDNFSGETKEFMMFNLMKGYANKKRQTFNKYYDYFLKECSNEKYKNYVKNLKIEDIKPGEEQLLVNSKGIKISLSDLLKVYKGKAIYIDFWASWCVPCIEELPASKLLASSLSDQITFLYFSLDKNKNLWDAAIKNLDLDPSRHFLVEGDFNSQLAKKLGIKTIPRYIIIDRLGKVISEDAARPSSKEIKGILKNVMQ